MRSIGKRNPTCDDGGGVPRSCLLKTYFSLRPGFLEWKKDFQGIFTSGKMISCEENCVPCSFLFLYPSLATRASSFVRVFFLFIFSVQLHLGKTISITKTIVKGGWLEGGLVGVGSSSKKVNCHFSEILILQASCFGEGDVLINKIKA